MMIALQMFFGLVIFVAIIEWVRIIVTARCKRCEAKQREIVIRLQRMVNKL